MRRILRIRLNSKSFSFAPLSGKLGKLGGRGLIPSTQYKQEKNHVKKQVWVYI